MRRACAPVHLNCVSSPRKEVSGSCVSVYVPYRYKNVRRWPSQEKSRVFPQGYVAGGAFELCRHCQYPYRSSRLGSTPDCPSKREGFSLMTQVRRVITNLVQPWRDLYLFMAFVLAPRDCGERVPAHVTRGIIFFPPFHSV